MKAFLLAGGLGTRLRPLTDRVPKPLVEIAGRPLLEWWLRHLEQFDVDQVLINTHHLPAKIEHFVASYRGPITIRLEHEPTLLGSAGTVHQHRKWVESQEQFLILYGDNLTNADLGELIELNRREPAPLSVGLFHAENPAACGIVQLDGSHIVDFQEKPEKPQGDLASAGMFVARQSLFEYLAPDFLPWDFGHDVMPRLVGQMNGVVLSGYKRDIGTPESLEAARIEWPQIHSDADNPDTSEN